MKLSVLIICLLTSINNIFCQYLPDLQDPLIDNYTSFFSVNYDIDLIKNNRVAACRKGNTITYFDTCGRVEKSVLSLNDSSLQTMTFNYGLTKSSLVSVTEIQKSGKFSPSVSYIFYENGRRIRDSISSGGWCQHWDYSKEGKLLARTFYGTNHFKALEIHINYDITGKLYKVIEKLYQGAQDSIGETISHRIFIYSEQGYLVKEEESIPRNQNNTVNLLCPNGGSVCYYYNDSGRLAKTVRTYGPSQKFKYLSNGLVSEIETTGIDCSGKSYSWNWKFEYTYR
ncbi:hypothetical protein [Foetidibacter luteolus]|uniref:hypothetical protein n=1 Tax=Foetidibacter luteolus TaxID=2608880 RepID=UPI00129AA82E|nr:hypothetical protein [Foetidibacter luteolus]